MDEDAPFDAMAELNRLTKLAPSHRKRKLDFERQCGAYAALWNGIRPNVVAATFCISLTSVSNLAGCREDKRTETVISVGEFSETFPSPSLTARRYRARKARYTAVAREWDRLGSQEFIRVYFTKQIAAELRNCMREMGLDV